MSEPRIDQDSGQNKAVEHIERSDAAATGLAIVSILFLIVLLLLALGVHAALNLLPG